MKIDEFETCKTCIVKANCTSLCDEYKQYIFEKTKICLKETFISRKEVEKFLKSANGILELGNYSSLNSLTMEINLEDYYD